MINSNTPKSVVIENSKSVLNKAIENSGYDVNITTLTSIRAKLVDQKFFEIAPSDYMPVIVGEGAFLDQQLIYKENYIGGDFEEGLVDSGSNSSKNARVESNIDSVLVKRHFWKKENVYNILELQSAQAAGNWSLVESKERAMIKNWQLGIQKVAFLGLESDPLVNGLLNATGVTSNTALITKDIKAMTATEFQAFLAGVIGAYFTNSASTVYPDTFIIPTDDFNGLGSAVSEEFNIKSRLKRMQEAFVDVTGNANFLIKGVPYCQQERNNLNLNRYVMYRRSDDTSLYMDIPVDYTSTVRDTFNGMDYTAVGYGQFSGCNVMRPLEVLYFDYAN